jgi:RHS repeat-associated protein
MKRTLYSLLLTLFVTISSIQTAQAGRMYDPEVSRFLSIDPILHETSPAELQKMHGGKFYSNSPYAYVFNNPVKYVDPDGKFPLAPAIPYLWAAAETAAPYVVAGVAAVGTWLGLNEIYDQAKEYFSNAEGKGKTGSGDNNTIGEITYPGDLNVRVDIEYPDATSVGEVHVQLKGKGVGDRKEKQRVEDRKDIGDKTKTDLPNSVRKDPKLGDLVEKGLKLLEKARDGGHNGYKGN